MRVDAEEERAVDPGLAAIEANGLRDRQNVRFVEVSVERRARWPEVPNATRCEGSAGSG
jgi:hypothetical protein